jgi:hypothetical protein
MNATCKIAFLIRRRSSLSVLLIGILLVSISACVICRKTYTDETMQPLAATASDLARAIMRFAKNNPEKAASLDDQELVRQATAFDPKLLEPYKGLVVRGTVDGVILVCTGDGRRGLFEDAECTDEVDRPLWSDENAPCQFTLNPRTVCP